MDLNYKLHVLKKNLKEKGLFYTFVKKIIPYIFKPLERVIRRNRFLVEIRYGILPNLFPQDFKILKVPQSELIRSLRKFWYSNTHGNFVLKEGQITRKEIFLYGGPNPLFSCLICQKSEWLSRIRQRNLFIPHPCPEAEKCKILCGYQGNDLWTHKHQNFNFAIGCDPDLPAPKALYIFLDKPEIFLTSWCDHRELIFRRQLALTCQVDVVNWPSNKINFSKYDFLFIQNIGAIQKFSRPNLPIIMYGHDFWPLEDRSFQWMIDWLKPDVLLTPYPTQWREYFKLPSKTKIVFYPPFASTFFNRFNLDAKKIDLLVIGAIHSSIYAPRRKLNDQLSQLPSKYKVEFSQAVGANWTINWEGPLETQDFQTSQKLYFLNKWSEYLGSSKYVIFGRMKFPVLVGKYYEALGSGAIPIFPEVPDLRLLEVKPFEHYIPLSEIEGNNDRLTYFLDHYEEFSYIAKNAVDWFYQNCDKMLFENFENLIQEITNNRYQKRLL